MSAGVTRRIAWRGLDGALAEECSVRLEADGLTAEGTQTGADPVPYRLDYVLDARGGGHRTRLLRVAAHGDGWSRRLQLIRAPDGTWECAAAAEGSSGLGPPGGDAAELAGAEDCDLGLSPLTNAMPLLRAGLHRAAGTLELTAAWVSVPDLAVRPSRQRYEHLGPGRVRYTDLGEFAGFSAEIELDEDGLVRLYPGLAAAVAQGEAG